jgi:hypothetical protein
MGLGDKILVVDETTSQIDHTVPGSPPFGQVEARRGAGRQGAPSPSSAPWAWQHYGR